MAKYSKKVIKILIIVIIIIVVFAIGGILIWKWKKSANNSSEKTNNEPKQVEKCFKCSKNCSSSPIKKDGKTYCSQKCADDNNGGNNKDNKNGDNKEKDLAEKIKADLVADFAKLEKGYIQAPKHWYDYIVSSGEDMLFLQTKKWEKYFIEKSDLEPDDWAEIVKEIKRLDQAKEEKYQTKIKEMATNPKLFLYQNKSKAMFIESTPFYHVFEGKEADKDYYLLIPTNHPTLNSIDLKENNWDKKMGTFYLISGVENISLETHSSTRRPYKIVKLEDKITIKLIEN